MKKPKLCVEPEETQDEYCMTDADLGNLTNLLQQANDICDYYQDMIQNRLGLLCVANAEAHDELIAMRHTASCCWLGCFIVGLKGGWQHVLD